jgi:hypothetical protein
MPSARQSTPSGVRAWLTAIRLAVDQQGVIFNFDGAGKAAMGRVETGQVGHAVQLGRFVDGDYLQAVGHRRLLQRAQKATADAAVSVDGKTQWLLAT